MSRDDSSESTDTSEETTGEKDISQTGGKEDQTLNCVQCGSQFVFSAEEQEFFSARGFTSPPKRCKSCRAARRKSRRGGGRGRMKEYRGPAFRERRDSDKMYRSPAFQKKQGVDNIYRSPAFQDQPQDEELYRGPAFRDQGPQEDIYRAPGFQSQSLDSADEPPELGGTAPDEEYDLEQGPPPSYREPRTADEIYRGPAFNDTDPAGYAPSYRKRQMHDIVCSSCGKKSQVPFKPRKDRPVYCKECYATQK